MEREERERGREVPGVVDHEGCTGVPSGNGCQDSDPSSCLGGIRLVSVVEKRCKREGA
jgi:hypothetical protein